MTPRARAASASRRTFSTTRCDARVGRRAGGRERAALDDDVVLQILDDERAAPRIELQVVGQRRAARRRRARRARRGARRRRSRHVGLAARPDLGRRPCRPNGSRSGTACGSRRRPRRDWRRARARGPCRADRRTAHRPRRRPAPSPRHCRAGRISCRRARPARARSGCRWRRCGRSTASRRRATSKTRISACTVSLT